MASVFKPYKNRLQTYKTRLQQIVSGIENFDVFSYQSLPDATKALKDLREDVKAQLAAVQNNLVITESALAASVASQATSGIAKAMLMIKTFAEEIVAAAQCFKLIGEIVVLLMRIPLLLSLKALELKELATKLALENVTNFLNDLKNDIINKINKAKAEAIAKVKTVLFSNQIKNAQTKSTELEQSIKDRTAALKSSGASDDSILKDSQLLAWNQLLKVNQSLLQLLNEQVS